jgi:hypothetical protein
MDKPPPSPPPKAAVPEDVWLRQDNSRGIKSRAVWITLMKLLSGFVLGLFFYGAFRRFHLSSVGKLRNIGSVDGEVADGDGRNAFETGKGSTYLLGVGKADITG